MHHINDLTEKVFRSAQTGQQTKRSEPAHSPEFLKAVLTSLTKMGLTHSPDRDQYLTWAAGLSDLSEKQIKMGLVKVRDFKGFFNLPAFRELCRISPEDIGLPDCKKAYAEACMAKSPKSAQKWSHPAVFHAGVSTGWFELSSFPEDQIYPRFKSFYEGHCKRVMNGEDLSAPMMDALPEKVTVFLEPEESKKKMDEMRSKLGI